MRVLRRYLGRGCVLMRLQKFDAAYQVCVWGGHRPPGPGPPAA